MTEYEYNDVINNLLVYYLGLIEKRLFDAISLTADERYRMLLLQQPEK